MGTGRVADKPRLTARAQGGFCILNGLWPLLHRRSFEAVFGPKEDYWLVATVSLLLLGNGAVLLTAPATPEGIATARRLGAVTGLAMATVDVVNVPRGRVSRMYLLDALAEGGWLWAWWRVGAVRR